MLTQLNEKGAALQAKRVELKGILDEFEKKGSAQAYDMGGQDMLRFKAVETEVNQLQDEFTALRSVYDAKQSNDGFLGQGFTPRDLIPASRKSLADQVIESKVLSSKDREYDFKDFDIRELLEAKATMTTSANGYPPQVLRDGTVVPAISRPPQLLDYLIMEPTTQNGISYMRQSVRTNTAAAKSEAAAADEATITYASVTDIISKIPVFIPVTDEQLEDEPGARSLVENDLILMVRQELDRQVTVGDGSAPNLRGIYNASSVQTQARGSDVTMDAIFKAMTLIRVTGRSNPGLVVLHGTDHQNLALTRTTDGLYILGNPTDSAFNRIWGLPVVMSEALTVTNALVLDPFYFRVVMRTGVEIKVSDSHASNFITGIQAIRATVRAGIKRMRDQAACRVTGLP